MNDRAVSLLEQYEIEVLRTRKGRGAIICDTNQGCLIFKEYTGNEDRIALQNKVLTHIGEAGKVPVEAIVPTAENTLFVKDNDGVKYILKTYREGRECNIYDKNECAEAVKVLARLHEAMELPTELAENVPVFSQAKEYEKHNKELKKVRKYLQQRSQKTWFEINLLNTFDYFLEQALSVTEEWQQYQQLQEKEVAQEKICFCHGDYQYHNILRCEKEWFIINFEKCLRDDSIRDLYLLLRKLLEKSNWSISMGTELLAAYETERPISAISRIDLYYRLAYPEKFWKIVNFYYNSGKAWIPERNQEKLEKLLEQENAKKQFLEEVFQKIS
uniref:CotS family spore coat protein n=1 Tax=Acetatifactor sp. TaxID=1872090 RepID=UPI004055C338